MSICPQLSKETRRQLSSKAWISSFRCLRSHLSCPSQSHHLSRWSTALNRQSSSSHPQILLSWRRWIPKETWKSTTKGLPHRWIHKACLHRTRRIATWATVNWADLACHFHNKKFEGMRIEMPCKLLIEHRRCSLPSPTSPTLKAREWLQQMSMLWFPHPKTSWPRLSSLSS